MFEAVHVAAPVGQELHIPLLEYYPVVHVLA